MAKKKEQLARLLFLIIYIKIFKLVSPLSPQSFELGDHVYQQQTKPRVVGQLKSGYALISGVAA